MTQRRFFYYWTKKIGPTHLFVENSSKTFCGIPMIGNNYPIDPDNADYCPDCEDEEHRHVR